MLARGHILVDHDVEDLWRCQYKLSGREACFDGEGSD